MKTTPFTEATRVQMPALIHLNRLGYGYIGKLHESDKNSVYDPATNILINEFKTQFAKLNPSRAGEAEQVLGDIRRELDDNDLGRKFYARLTAVSPVRLIDFDNLANNTFHCTAEFTCERDQEEFRPDITLFVNGLPLVFIEVKRPNNQGGMVAESERMNRKRFPNPKFRRFINITQLMLFSNNMEYDALGGIVPVQGAFYCTAAKERAPFNCFREENPAGAKVAPFIESYPYAPLDEQLEKRVLADFNCQVIRNAPEYQTNLGINTPTNRIITSMCAPERLLFILKYGIAYLQSTKEDENGNLVIKDEKHIMRYQQMFAALKIREQLERGVNSGIVWHTQGSGKTALSYHLNHVLADSFAKKDIVTQFYFIVDRLDLLEQASEEFEARGLSVQKVNSRQELMAQFRTHQAQYGKSGKREITVVNIQKFGKENDKVEVPPYATNLQRVFIIDEAHRGYNPTGSFLSNLFEADKKAIKIALTGTPLLKEERASWKVFGEYFHSYYYDKSIQDGYTLKIIREDIETSYRERLSEVYEELETLVTKKDVPKTAIIEHENYVRELLRYIITDLKKFRQIRGDNTLGGMVICETSEQARKLHALFDEVQHELNEDASLKSHFKVGLILHDSDDKDTRKKIVSAFKQDMTIDILIVFNMLLTGFDAKRLKRLYFGRKLKDHNLLQAITRVNRPYKDNRYGYVIDFADIKQNFEETNEEYLRELNRFNDPKLMGEGNTTETFRQVLEEPEALVQQMKEVQQVLYSYSTNNLEEFCSEISTLEDREELLKLKKALVAARDCCNVVRTFGDDELKAEFAKMEFPKITQMISEIQRCISAINQKEAFHAEDTVLSLVNEAMQNITFKFNKRNEEEMKLACGGVSLQEKWRDATNAFITNIDPDDPEYITIHEAFRQRFKEKGFEVASLSEYEENIAYCKEVLKKLTELHKRNQNLLKKYQNDVKYARLHKRICEENAERAKRKQKPIVSPYEQELENALLKIKTNLDQKVFDRNNIIQRPAYFDKVVMHQISSALNELHLPSERSDREFIQRKIAKQYTNQFNAEYQFA